MSPAAACDEACPSADARSSIRRHPRIADRTDGRRAEMQRGTMEYVHPPIQNDDQKQCRSPCKRCSVRPTAWWDRRSTDERLRDPTCQRRLPAEQFFRRGGILPGRGQAVRTSSGVDGHGTRSVSSAGRALAVAVAGGAMRRRKPVSSSVQAAVSAAQKPPAVKHSGEGGAAAQQAAGLTKEKAPSEDGPLLSRPKINFTGAPFRRGSSSRVCA